LVRDVRVLKGHPILAQSAADTVKQWRFQAAVRAGRAVPVRTQFTLVFRLPRIDVKAEIARYRERVRQEPADSEARMKLGWALQREKDLEGAIAQYQEALRLNPDDPQLHVDLGSAFFRSGELEEALTEFRAATAADPELACGYFGIWLVLSKKGHKAGAEEALQAASLAKFK
jgi:tetratricopeptide (TPR) repeat protein